MSKDENTFHRSPAIEDFCLPAFNLLRSLFLNRKDNAKMPQTKIDSLLGEEKKDDSFNNSFSISAVDDDGSEANDEVKTKLVKFAEDEAEKQDAELDQERSRQELLSKIARLTDILNEAQQQVKAEKDKRKKKEKSLLKLAKELKKRNLVREKEEDRLEEVR